MNLAGRAPRPGRRDVPRAREPALARRPSEGDDRAMRGQPYRRVAYSGTHSSPSLVRSNV